LEKTEYFNTGYVSYRVNIWPILCKIDRKTSKKITNFMKELLNFFFIFFNFILLYIIIINILLLLYEVGQLVA
jgi:hypothetical protein